MVLYPLAVVLLAQFGILLLVIIFYQRLQKKRLLNELEGLKSSAGLAEPALDLEEPSALFDQAQAALLLNRINQGTDDIVSEAPAAKELCQRQQQLVKELSKCLGLTLEPAKKAEPIIPAAEAQEDSDDILSQDELDRALGEGPEELEGLDEQFEGLDGLDELEDLEDDKELQGGVDELEGLDDLISDDAEPEEYDPLVKSEKAAPAEDDEADLPEDTLQKTLDSLDDYDFSDLEAELFKDDDSK